MRKVLFAVIFIALSFAVPAIGRSQTSSPVWYTLSVKDGDTITATGPITLRYGQVASTCAAVWQSCQYVGQPTPETWTSPQTFTGSTVSVVVGPAAFGGVDPLPGVYKTVQIQEQSTAQNITVNGQSVTVPATSSGSSGSSGNWYTLNVKDGDTITATSSITLRYGQVASTCVVAWQSCQYAGQPTPETWTSPQTFTPSGSSSVSIVVGPAAFGGVDPLPGVVKTVQIQQLSSAQTITVNGQSVTVPAASSGSSGSWYTLNVKDGGTVSATASITLRYGQVASTCVVQTSSGPCTAGAGAPSQEAWTNAKTFTPSGSSTVSITVGPAAFGGVDPLPGVYKTVQIQQTSSAQTITVNGQSVTVPATGSSAPPCQLTASPSSISFQNTNVGYTYSSQASLVNNCTTAITVNSVQVSGPYSTSGFQTPFSVAAGQTQNYTAVFAPTAAGAATGSVAFTTSANTGQALSVSLSGTGVGNTGGGTGVSHSVSLTWSGSGSGVAGYNVYRSTVSGGPYSKINSSLDSQTSYTDGSVSSGTTYYYAVTAVGTNGMESADSNQVTAAVPNP